MRGKSRLASTKELTERGKSSCCCCTRQVRAPGDGFKLRNLKQLVQQSKSAAGIAFGLYGIHFSATCLSREERDL